MHKQTKIQKMRSSSLQVIIGLYYYYWSTCKQNQWSSWDTSCIFKVCVNYL